MVVWSVRGDVAKTLVKAVTRLVSEARVHVNDEGIHVRAVDPANVAMVIVNLPRESCEGFAPPENGNLTIGLDFARVEDFLKSAKKKDTAIFRVVHDENKLAIKVGNIEYSLSLIDPSSIRIEPGIPELELPAKVVLDGKQFKDAINTVDKVGDHVTLMTDENGFYMYTQGDVDSIKFHMGEMELIEFNKEKAKSMFSLEYLKELTKILGPGDIVTVKLGDNYPVWLTFDVADGMLKVEYILAPRIEET